MKERGKIESILKDRKYEREMKMTKKIDRKWQRIQKGSHKVKKNMDRKSQSGKER